MMTAIVTCRIKKTLAILLICQLLIRTALWFVPHSRARPDRSSRCRGASHPGSFRKSGLPEVDAVAVKRNPFAPQELALARALGNGPVRAHDAVPRHFE